MKKILSGFLSCIFLFSSVLPVYTQPVAQLEASSSAPEELAPEQLVASLNEIYERFQLAQTDTVEDSFSKQDREEAAKEVAEQLGEAIFLLYEMPGYKSVAEDFIFKLFPYVAPFLNKEKQKKGIRVLHKIILADSPFCTEGDGERCQRAIMAAAVLGLMGTFDKNSEEVAALAHFLMIGSDTPFYPYIIQAVASTLLAVAPDSLADVLMGVKVSPDYGLFSGDYTLDVHSVFSKVLVGNGFSRGMERSFYPSGKGGRNLLNAWSDFGRMWAKEAFAGGEIKNSLDKLLAWCIKDASAVKFRPFVAGVLSTGYIYKSPAFTQQLAKNMFKMGKGDLDPFTATYMENLLAMGFHKAGGRDEGFNQLLSLQLMDEAKRALLETYTCPPVSGFKERVRKDELPRGVICQWQYASADKINADSLKILTVDVIGHAIDGILMVASVPALAKMGMAGIKNAKHFYSWIKASRVAGKSSAEIVKMMLVGAKLKGLSAYQVLVSSIACEYNRIVVGKGAITAKAVLAGDISAALGKMPSADSPFKSLLINLNSKLKSLPNEVSDLQLGESFARILRSASMDSSSNPLLKDLLKHPAAIAEMEKLLKENPAGVAKRLRSILKNKEFLEADGFKYFEILDKKTLVPVVETQEFAVGATAMPYAEWIMQMGHIDEVAFKVTKTVINGIDLTHYPGVRVKPLGPFWEVSFDNPLATEVSKNLFNGLLAEVKADIKAGRLADIKASKLSDILSIKRGKSVTSLGGNAKISVGTRSSSVSEFKTQLLAEDPLKVLSLAEAETDPIVLLQDLYRKTLIQLSQLPNVSKEAQVNVRLTSAELPSDISKMHVHLEIYDPAKGYLINQEFLLYGTEVQRKVLLSFIKSHAPASATARFNVFDIPVVKKGLVSSVDSGREMNVDPLANYVEMYA